MALKLTEKPIKIHIKTDLFLIVLILLILLATLLRFYNLGGRSLWLDEAITLHEVRAILQLPPYEAWSFSDFFYRENRKLPPLYFIYAVPFYYLSESEWVMRLASVVWGIATIPLFYRFGAELFNRKIGLIGALLLTFSPFHIFYSQELRPYSLFLFLSLALFYFSYLALEENKNIHYVGMIVAATIGLYTHTYIVFPLFMVNLYFLFGWKRYRHLLPKWLGAHLVIVILALIAIYHALYRVTAGSVDVADFPSGLRSVVGTFYIFTMGRFFFPTGSNLIFIIVQGIIFGAGLLLGTWALWRETTNRLGYQRLSYLLIAGMTYVIIWLISLYLLPLFDEARVNYLIFLLPFYYLLVAKGWDYLRNSVIQTVLISLAVLLSLISLYPFYFEWDQVGKGDFRAAAAYIQRNFEQGDAVYHADGGARRSFDYYFHWQVPQNNVTRLGSSDSHERIWLIVLNQQGGFDFGLESLRRPQISAQDQQQEATSSCNSHIKNGNLHLIDLKVFPGKNEVIICLYRQEHSL